VWDCRTYYRLKIIEAIYIYIYIYIDRNVIMLHHFASFVSLLSFVELKLAVFLSTTFLWNTFGCGEMLEELHSSCPQKRILRFVSSVHSFPVLTNNGKYRQIYGKLLQYQIYTNFRRGSRNFSVNTHRNNHERHWFAYICCCSLWKKKTADMT